MARAAEHHYVGMRIRRLIDKYQQDDTDADTADDSKRNHARCQNNTCADGPEQERNVQGVLDGGTETDNGKSAHHTKGQDNIGSHGKDDRCRNHGQGNQSGAEACGIHHAPVGFLVNKENEQTNAKGQQDGQNHVKDTDRGYFF